MADVLLRFLKRIGLIQKGLPSDTFVYTIARDVYKYIENDHAVEAFAEILSPPKEPSYRSLDRGALERQKHWLPPHDQEMLSEVDIDRIMSSMEKFFQSRGARYKIKGQN